MILHDPDGAKGLGHGALLVGSKTDGGYTYMSKDGGISGVSGDSKFTVEQNIKSISEFLSSPSGLRYKDALIIGVPHEVAQGLINTMKEELSASYNLAFRNCMEAVTNAMYINGMAVPRFITTPNDAFQYMKDVLYTEPQTNWYWQRH